MILKNSEKLNGYAMNKEQLKNIFIEEASEIIEKLDADIVDFESDTGNKELINELFRGVHTLKGNANAFGFTRLGGFVHHFEDLLDNYRSPGAVVPESAVDTLLKSVDVIKETLNYEVAESDGLPENYDECLSAIIALLDGGSAKATKDEPPLKDLASEFSANEVQIGEDSSGLECAQRIKQKISADGQKYHIDGKTLYAVDFIFDKDIYFRGYDHIVFLKMLSDVGDILHTYWDMEHVPKLSEFAAEDSYLPLVSVLLASEKPEAEISEIFEFLFEHEYAIRAIEAKAAEIAAAKEEIKPQGDAPKKIEEQEQASKLPESKQQTSSVVKKEESAQKSYIKIDTAKLDELFDTVGELVIAQNFIAQNENIKDLGDSNINKTIETLSKITKTIQDRVMSLRMVAIRDTFEKMKRVARDTAKKTGKDIKLVIQGEETEIDKTMIDSLSDPIVHMIRNAIDHGLEDSNDEREAKGKERDGTISLRAFHKSGNIIIAISDDGRGIDKEAVLKKGIERGLVDPNDTLTDQQIFSLIMQPGFSTAKTISDISGRGVGLDVVKTSIEKLRGKVEIDSEIGYGSTFSIILPLTLAIIDGMLVKSGGETFIIPTLSVVESFVPQKEIVHMLKGRGEFVNLRGEQIPVIRLDEALDVKTPHRPQIWESTLVCVDSERGRFAILVDALLGRQQVVIKSLGRSMAKIREISGGAILGNGDIALILNIDGLCSESDK